MPNAGLYEKGLLGDNNVLNCTKMTEIEHKLGKNPGIVNLFFSSR